MIVYLYAVEGLSMAEIATATGFTEAAVKVRAHRSYLQLRDLLALGMFLFFLMRFLQCTH